MTRFMVSLAFCFVCGSVHGFPAPKEKELPVNIENLMGTWKRVEGDSLPRLVEFGDEGKMLTGETDASYSYSIVENQLWVVSHRQVEGPFPVRVKSLRVYSIKSLTSKRLSLDNDFNETQIYRRIKNPAP